MPVRRADRLFQIVQQLRSGRLMTAARLADRLEVSVRTIYRDIRDLSLSGVPIEGEAGVGYMLRGGFDVPPLMFNADEVESLVLGARLVKAWGGKELALAASEALDKIEAALPERLRHRVNSPRLFAPSWESEGPAPHLDALRQAINGRQVIRIRYQSLEEVGTQRCVWPLGLFFWGKIWTLVSWCELRQDYRSFRVDRVQALEQVGREFAESEQISLRQYLRQWE